MTTADNENREPPFSDAELAELWPFDEPWPFNDDDGVEDDEELDMLRSLERGEWKPVANHEAELERYRTIAHTTIATWDKERLAAVRSRWANASVKDEGAEKSAPSLADDGNCGDNREQPDS